MLGPECAPCDDEDWEDLDGDFYADRCPTCGGDGAVEYNDHPETWDGDTPDLKNHFTTCRNCMGSGLSKDCSTW